MPALAFAIAAIASFLVAPLTGHMARRLGILDHPDPSGYKSHPIATPYLGGIAIAVGFALGSSVLLLPAEEAGVGRVELLAAVSIAFALGAFGLADDVRPLPRLLRFIAQLLAAGAAWMAGFRVESTPWTALDVFITLVWIVGMTNAFNLLDNMDGLSSGLAGIGAVSFTILAITNDLTLVATTAASLAGAALAFLAHNRHPAKLFMGDAGSLFLGFMLALIGVELRFENLVEVTFLVPVVVLGLPIFDTTLVIASRLRNGRSPFVGGRDHVSHRLVKLGLPVKAAVGLLYWSGLCLGWLGLVISRSNVEVGWMLLGFVLALGVFFGWLLWKVPVHPDEDPQGHESSPLSQTAAR